MFLRHYRKNILWKLHNILQGPALLTIYKYFIKPHVDDGDIIHDQAYNLSLHQELESIRYHPVLALTGTIRGSSREVVSRARFGVS